MQPYLFPYIGYFQLMASVDKFVLYDDVNFINRGWINRNTILVNGQAHLFTVPLKDASQNKLINEIHLDEGQKWREKFLRTIEQNYKKAPYFQEVTQVINSIIAHQVTKLSELIEYSFKCLSTYLGLTTEIVPTSEIYQNSHLKSQDRILDICKQEGATIYINAIGGVALYHKPDFEQVGITLQFHKAHRVAYPQFGKDFVPWLSILDVMMFNSPEQIRKLLTAYDLV